MAPKGLSVDEKRKRIEAIFHETGEFYQLKDIEKLASKRGVVLQSVKDVLSSLVDDGLVVSDKIGTSNYFWSYPSDSIQKKKNALLELETKVKKEEEKKDKLEQQIIESKSGREEAEDRQTLLSELKEQEEKNKELKKELQKYKENDPELYNAKEKAAIVAKAAVNRWTENIWELQSYCAHAYNYDRATLAKNFGIPDDFDTI